MLVSATSGHSPLVSVIHWQSAVCCLLMISVHMDKSIHRQLPGAPQSRHAESCNLCAGKFADKTPEFCEKLISVNYMGVVHTLKAVLPILAMQDSGHIMVTNSLAGYAGRCSAIDYQKCATAPC